MRALLWLIDELIWIYVLLLIAQAILSWLLAFGVINRYNRGVAVIGDFLYRITEPALRPIRRFLPNFGGIDISLSQNPSNQVSNRRRRRHAQPRASRSRASHGPDGRGRDELCPV